MNLQKHIKEVKENLMQKLDIMDCFAEDRLFFIQHSKNTLLVGVEMFDYLAQDKYFYLYNCEQKVETSQKDYKPVAMIKFMPEQNNKDEMFIRRLEFIDDSFRGKGYASCLIILFETYCAKNNYKNISGELIPLHNVPEQIVENYYRKNGFEITTINGQKIIDKKIKAPLQVIIEGVTLVQNPLIKTKTKQPELEM